MKNLKTGFLLDKDKAQKNAQEILEKLHNDTDLLRLREYHRLFKKEIPFFRRAWAAAWLFMYYDQKETPRLSKPENLQSKKKPSISSLASIRSLTESKGSADKAFPEVSPPSLPEEESKRLFVSIGKNRRLFPREILTLIMTNTSAAREDIGTIKILDNFSFVQVRSTKADEIIEALNGIKFKGRTLAVNFAKSREQDTESKE